MLTLNPGSSCDVCAEEYGPHCLPHSIPCGHVLCSSCCTTIAEKTSSRLSPACPFCREHFTSDSVRLIRMDFNTSGWSTPRRMPDIEANPPDFISDAWSKRLMLADGCSRSRQDARRLEAKVAKVAAKKCSVEEVTTLHHELQEWLTSDVKPNDDTSSLTLSAALLRAILMNHVAHSEASRTAKNVEATLKTKLDDLEIMNSKLEAELRRSDFNTPKRHRSARASAKNWPGLRSSRRPFPCLLFHHSPSRAIARPHHHQCPHSPPPITPPRPSPALNSTHMRSSSMFASSRPTTPAPGLARSQTPGPISSTRSQTPVPSALADTGPHPLQQRQHGPHGALPTRSQASAPPSRAGSLTPTPTRHVSMSMASAPLRPRPRRRRHVPAASRTPSPPKMAARTLSEEKHDAQAL
ncbi:hypothetical protein B0H11DRAFT_2038898, partial [Mycena galericulata]